MTIGEAPRGPRKPVKLSALITAGLFLGFIIEALRGGSGAFLLLALAIFAYVVHRVAPS